MKPPYTKWINDIKAKLGFTRTMTASGEDVVDAVNKQADVIEGLGPVNNLTSDSVTAALSAAQGKVLNDKITISASTRVERGSAISSGTLDNNLCIRQGQVVNASGRIYNMTNQAANGVFFKIPEGFRPKTSIPVFGYMFVVSTNAYTVVIGNINTDGDVTMTLSQSLQASIVQFTTSYGI